MDVDRIENHDDQLPHYDLRFLPDRSSGGAGKSQGSDDFVSGTAANVILRELCASGRVFLRQELDRGQSSLYFFDGAGFASSPLMVLVASWESWAGILGLALGGAQSRRLRAQEACGFRLSSSRLDRAEVAAQSMPDAAERSRVLQLIEGLRAIHAKSEAVDYTSTGAGAELRSSRMESQDQWESIFLDDDVEDPEDVGGMLENVLEDLDLDESEVFDVSIAPWDDGMAWGALPSTRQIELATAVIEERLEPASRLACLLMQHHAGTSAEVKSLIALSGMPGIIALED